MEGFVKLPRILTEWGWYGDNNMLAVYVRLLMTAAWSDFEYQNIKLKRGQLVTTYPKLVEESGLSVQQIRTVIDRLKSTGKIEVEKNAKFSIITIIDYDGNSTNNTQNNSQSTVCQQSDNSQPTVEQQSYIII